MIGAVIAYILLLAGLAAFYVLYIDSIALVVLLCMLVLPVLLWIWTRLVRRRARCSVVCHVQSCIQGESIPVSLQAENPGMLFLPRVCAAVRLEHAFCSKPEVLHLRFPLHGRNTTRLTFHVRAAYCGALRITPVRVRGYDPLLLTAVRLRMDTAATDIIILPRPVPVEITRAALPVPSSDSDRYAPRPGDDPSEIYQIREYQPGDPVSRIHWKLTARTGTPYLKELGCPVESCCLLLVQAVRDGQSGDMQHLEALMTLAYSLPLALVRAGEPFLLAWMDTDGTLRQRTADHEAALAPIFREIFSSIRTDGIPGDVLSGHFAGRAYSSAVLVTNDEACTLLPLWEQSLSANEKACILVTQEEAVVSDTVRLVPVSPDNIPCIHLIV